MDSRTDVRPRRQTLSAVVTRADGTVIDVGVVAAAYRNPFKQLWWRLVGLPAANRRIRRANKQHAASQ